ncbi:MAG: hypothetical protein AAGF85_17785 [Bacteroidota bacterium]
MAIRKEKTPQEFIHLVEAAKNKSVISDYEIIASNQQIVIDLSISLTLSNIKFNSGTLIKPTLSGVNIFIHECYFVKKLELKSDYKETLVSLSNCSIGVLKLSNFRGSYKANQSIATNDLNNVISLIKLTGNIEFSNQGGVTRLSADTVEFSNCNLEGISFSVVADKIILRSVRSIDKMDPIDMYCHDLFMGKEIKNITFGKLINHKSFLASNAKLLELKIGNLVLRGTLKSRGSNIEDLKINLLQIRDKRRLIEQGDLDTASRLRLVCERSNYIYFARYFQSVEQEMYFHTLTWKGDLIEKAPLSLSHITNKFRRNWWLPLLWIFGLSHLFYFIATIPYISLTLYSDFWGTIGAKFFDGHSLTFMLPTHRLSLVFPNNPSALVVAIDFVQRIVSGFLIFQFIRAFRFNFQTK